MQNVDDDFLEPEENSDERIGRYVLNSFGHREVVIMRYANWRYLDWLTTRGIVVDCLTADCDMRKGYWPLSEEIAERIYQIFCYRCRHEKEQPPYLKDDIHVLYWKELN